MKLILSPARRMKMSADQQGTLPVFQSETEYLLAHLRQYAPWQLESIFKANAKLSSDAFFDYQHFGAVGEGCPALFAYDGLVYKNLDPASLSQSALDYATDSLRILSALYGVLRPFDLVRPYRLEMITKLQWDEGTMYAFWKDKLYRALYASPDCVVNLASEEYAKCIRPHLKPQDRFIDIVFIKSLHGRIPTTLAKMARGQMARFMLENRTQQPEELKCFDWNGFVFSPALSTPARYVFCAGHRA